MIKIQPNVLTLTIVSSPFALIITSALLSNNFTSFTLLVSSFNAFLSKTPNVSRISSTAVLPSLVKNNL